MKKTGGLCILLLLLSVTAAAVYAQETVTLDSAITETADYLNERLPAGSKVLVLNFKSEHPALSDHVINELISHIVNTRVLTAVDRQNMDIIRQEISFQMSGEVSDESAQAIGKKLGAQTIVSGEIVPFGRQYRLRVRAISVETAVIQGTLSRTIATDSTLRTLTGGKAPAIDTGSANTGFKLSAGGGVLLGLEFYNGSNEGRTEYPDSYIISYNTYTNTSNRNSFDLGIFAFFDATYAEVDMAMYWDFGSYNWSNNATYFYRDSRNPSIVTSSGTSKTTRSYFDFGVLGKYPFGMNKATVFPLLGFQYAKLLSVKYEDGSKATGDLSGNNAFWIKFGGGFDNPLKDSIFLRGELLYGIKFHSKGESESIDRLSNGKDNKAAYSTHGPTVKLAIGYRF